MTVFSTIRIDKSSIPDFFKIFEPYNGNYEFKIWPDLEKIKEIFEKNKIEVAISQHINSIEIEVNTIELHKTVSVLEKYEFIK